jgi:hypothetical protein
VSKRRKGAQQAAVAAAGFVHPYDRLHPLTQAALAAGMSIVIGLALAWLSNHSSIAETVKRMTARLYLPALSSTYPTEGRDAITVITIDDADLEKRRLAWPVPLTEYKALIERLLRHEPKAIFLDIVFLDNRPSDETEGLARAACRAREQGVPVYLASLQGQVSRSSETERTLLWARTYAGQPCISPVAPNISIDRYERSAWEYPLRVERSTLPPAALAMACDAKPALCPSDLSQDMALVWGSRPAPINEQLMLDYNDKGELEPVCRSEWSWLELVPKLGGLLRQLPTPDWLVDRLPDNDWWATLISFKQWKQPLCVYNRTLPLRALDAGQVVPLEEVREALHQRFVLIGTDFQSRGDSVMAPLQGRVPGVHAHAMALDNLISFRGEYRQAGDFALSLPLTRATQYTIIAVALLAVGMVAWGRFTRYLASHSELPRPVAPERLQGSGASSALGKRKGMRRIASFVYQLCKKLFSLGLYAAVPPRHNRWYRFGRPALAALLAVLGIWLLFQIGDRLLHVGPLSLIEFLLFPLGVEFMHGGEKAARLLATIWDASGFDDAKRRLVELAVRAEHQAGTDTH